MAESADLQGIPELVLLPAGATFGNYIVRECIGQGAMGSVYRAEHALLRKPVALKVMDVSLLASADARQRFLREGQAAAAIKHPNVVDIADVGVCDDVPYLVMELLEGEDLASYLEQKKQLSEAEVTSLVIPIVAALAAAHDSGVVHRDLKPSNIFLSIGADGEVIPKVLDFGISKLAESVSSKDFEATPFNQLMGSPLYLPPEAVRGGRDLTAKSDQYSLGVVLYECITGKSPFAGDSLLSLLTAISAGDFPRPSSLRGDISVTVERAIMRAMESDPARRFDHVRDLGRALLDVATMRTQMLWGRSFGRPELTEAPQPRSSAPVTLLDLEGARGRERKRGARSLIIGALALAAVLVPSLWASRSTFETASGSATLAPPLERREAALTPPRSMRDPLPTAAALAGGASGAEPASADASNAVARSDATASGNEESDERSRLANKRNKRAAGAERGGRRVPALPDPRATREPAGVALAPDSRADEMRELFALPGSAVPPRSSRPGPSNEFVGANESPILD